MTCCTYDCNQGRSCPVRQTRVDQPKTKTCAELGGGGPDGCDACAGQGFCNGECGDIDPDAPDGPLWASACYLGSVVVASIASLAVICGLIGYAAVKVGMLQ